MILMNNLDFISTKFHSIFSSVLILVPLGYYLITKTNEGVSSATETSATMNQSEVTVNTSVPTIATTTMPSILRWENNEEIKIFREYLRIPSVHPNVDYS